MKKLKKDFSSCVQETAVIHRWGPTAGVNHNPYLPIIIHTSTRHISQCFSFVIKHYRPHSSNFTSTRHLFLPWPKHKMNSFVVLSSKISRSADIFQHFRVHIEVADILWDVAHATEGDENWTTDELYVAPDVAAL